ncbi:MAG: DUF547 domain-containing protein [Elainellaceae cyanobacterium]
MIDFTIWNQLLSHYVNQQGQVNYRRWKQESSETLAQWLRKTQACLSHEHQDRAIALDNTQLATWINLYNALTIAQVLEHYPIGSIQPKILGIPNWLGFLSFFMKPVYWFDGQSLSLNDIEHKILRKQFHDPRIHFALVCASKGCPLLRPEAYCPEQIQTQLDEDADRFINNSAKIRYDAEHHVLYCSKIFKWYCKDFLMESASVQTYVEHYWQGASISPAAALRYLPYDWQLNDHSVH